MPSLSTLKELAKLKTNGEVRKSQSDMIIEHTWWEDIASQTAYLFDWYHDNYKTQLKDFINPEGDSNFIPIDIKYIINSAQTFSKDVVTYHLQMRPSQKCNVDYYDEVFGKRYGANFPNGLYVLIKDNQGKYNRWLIVANANYYDPMYSTYEILPCDKIFQWIYEGKKYNMAGVLRSQNS